jgi:hypothetical protein
VGFKIDVVRPDDLLNFKVEGINLQLDSSEFEKPVLVVDDPKQAAFLAITFPPQTIAEHAYFEAAIIKPPPSDPTKPKVIAPESNPQRKDQETETSLSALDMPGDVKARIGRPTRLVFKVPRTVRIPFSVAGLLDWSGLELSVNPIAAISRVPTADQIAKAPAIKQPTATETAIELPYRLVISPTSEVAWLHRLGPFTSRGRTELWHTRLANKVARTPAAPNGLAELTRDRTASLRAIWSPDYLPYPAPEKLDDDLGRTAMSPNDRHQIVVLTSAFHGYEVTRTFGAFASPALNPFILANLRSSISFSVNVPYVPEPFEASQLMLSPLGGWLKSRGHWSPPHPTPPNRLRVDAMAVLLDPVSRALAQPPRRRDPFADLIVVGPSVFAKTEPSLDLSEWVHLATQGRDHYVRIVYEGELWGFRNRAALIKITERKFKEHNGIIGAYLIQRMFIVVREPEKTYAETDYGNPFKRVRLTTLVTPDIAEPVKVDDTYRSFWVEVMTSQTDRARFRFHGVGYDANGNAVDFTAPLLFVSKSDYEDPAKAIAYFNENLNIIDRNVEIPGQKLMFAKPDPTNSNTQLVTERVNFFMDPARVQPRMLRATVKIPQVQELLGTDEATTIRLFPTYVANGFDAKNKTGVFAQIVDANYSDLNPSDPNAGLQKMQNDFRADKAGGFATPNLGVSMLSRQLGPLAGKVADAVDNKFNPAEFFPKSGGAKLFGTFDLMDLLLPVTLGKNAPQMLTTTRDGGKLVVTTLDWQPEFTGKNLGVAEIRKDAGSTFVVHAEIKKSITPGGAGTPPTSEFNGKLTNFTVIIVGSVALHFTEFSFVTRTNQKPDVGVKLAAKPLEFMGDLQFVEELRNVIPPGLFGQGPSLDLLQNPLGIRAGFAFALPPVTVGVFALKDVSIGAALTLPFIDGKPVFDFNFCERQHPFLLTVSIFGGGGFFHLQLDTAGIKLLEAALEFGAAAAIDIGVASGEVHIMAGIYFSLQRKEGSTKLEAVLSGYLRMGGSLSVLGIIKVTVEFNLSFTYDSGRDKAYGRATLTVEIEIIFFSISVELTVERAFGGSGDPKFGQLFSEPQMWNDYALAFA